MTVCNNMLPITFHMLWSLSRGSSCITPHRALWRGSPRPHRKDGQPGYRASGRLWPSMVWTVSRSAYVSPQAQRLHGPPWVTPHTSSPSYNMFSLLSRPAPLSLSLWYLCARVIESLLAKFVAHKRHESFSDTKVFTLPELGTRIILKVRSILNTVFEGQRTTKGFIDHISYGRMNSNVFDLIVNHQICS